MADEWDGHPLAPVTMEIPDRLGLWFATGENYSMQVDRGSSDLNALTEKQRYVLKALLSYTLKRLAE